MLARRLAPLRGPLSAAAYRKVTVVALILLVFIVVTGAGVRLTGSGLGCTDWPNCTDERFVAQLEAHQLVEFVNRLITGLVSVAVAVAVLGSRRRVPRRTDLVWLSWGLVAGVVGQIALGALVVRSGLDPWLVQGHFVVSMLLVADAVALAHRAARPDDQRSRPAVTPSLLRWGRVLVALAAVVVITGTVVTGAGPHSGHNPADVTRIRRLPLSPHDAARIHGTAMVVFLAVTTWVLVQLRRHGSDELVRRATALVTVLVLQAAVGYTQYFTGVPPLLVGLHVLGASLVWVAVLQTYLAMTAPVGQPVPRPAQSAGGPDRSDRTDRLAHGDLLTRP